jgi:hypothetical protein
MMSPVLYLGDVKQTRHDEGTTVSLEERRAWIRLAVSVLAYGAYLAVVLARAHGRPLAEVPFGGALVASVLAAIGAAILAEIVVNTLVPGPLTIDARDREVGRLGDQVGQSFVVIGALAAMLLAIGDADRFWIANAVYLGFVCSAVLGGVTRVIAYRRGLPEW